MPAKTHIQRAKHGKDNPYFLMLRATAQDETLSYEARGMLAYLLSKPDHWRVEVHDLQIAKKCGRDKVYSILDELKAAGYVRRERTKNEKGLFVWGDYEVSEYPFPENPYTDKPDMDKPYTDNPPQDNTEKKIVQTKKKQSGWTVEELAISEAFGKLTNAMVKPHEEQTGKIVEQNRVEAALFVQHGITGDLLVKFYRETYTNGYTPSTLGEIRKKLGAWLAKQKPTKPSNGKTQFQSENSAFAKELNNARPKA